MAMASTRTSEGRGGNTKGCSSKRKYIIFTTSIVILLHFLFYNAQEIQLPVTVTAPDEATLLLPMKIPSGWDDQGIELYTDRHNALPNWGHREITFWHYQQYGQFWVSNDECNNKQFWEIATRGGWERGTFNIFQKYTVPNETIVVDFGTWIGPTLLFHGSFSRRSFGIEADPVAYAVAEYNVELNQNKTWGKQVSVDHGCVATPEDVPLIKMKAGGKPGMSMSGIGEHVARDRGPNAVTWFVACYTLSDIFENYWFIKKPYKDILIKIDIESYECKLVPSFYDWLKNETYLPKMFISFHPQIAGCTDEEYEGIVTFFQLYDHVRFGDKHEYDVQNATGEDFKTTISSRHDIDNSVVAYQAHHAEQLTATK